MRTGKGWRLAEAARNMTARRHRRFSYGDWLCFCFIAGVTAGTAAALSFGNAASAEIRAFEYAVPSASLWAAGLKARLADAVVAGGIKKTLANGVFLTVLIKRLFQAGAGRPYDLQPFLFRVPDSLGRDVRFCFFCCADPGKGGRGAAVLSLVFISSGNYLFFCMDSPCRLGRGKRTAPESGGFSFTDGCDGYGSGA